MTVLKARVVTRQVTEAELVPVVFDPCNDEHRNAFRIMVLAGRQSTFRFQLEGFDSVPSMMMYKMAVFGAGALDKASMDTRTTLMKRHHLHEVPNRFMA